MTGYRVYRGTTEIANLASTARSYTDSGLNPGTYSYTVKAYDAAANLSDPSNTATGTVPDVTKPSPPGTLTATGSAGQVALGWGAATDNVAVTGYRVYRGTTEIANLASTARSYTDSGLNPGTYSYTVKAYDAAANLSDPSNTATGTVPDVTKPSPPGTLTATGSAGQVALGWGAATDNVAVTGYRVYRGTTEIANLASTARSYTDSGLNPGTYSYTVKAYDAAANLSDPSNTATGTVPDVTKPSIPQNLVATRAGPLQIDLTWSASTDNVAVTGYKVYRDDQLIATVGATPTSYSDSLLLPGSYTYYVRAIDAAGNTSDPSDTATASTFVPDTEKPTPPANLGATRNGFNVDLAWTQSDDNVGVTGYKVYRDDARIANIGPAASYSDTTVMPGPHSYVVRATDSAGNLSDPSNTATITVPDTEGPTAPLNLTATEINSSRVDLSWDPSDDNVGVTGYEIYREGSWIETTDTVTSYSDTTVTPGSYSYQVVAFDAAGNPSDFSNGAAVTVQPPDTEAPTAPGNLVATASGASIGLTWEASHDNRAVTGYDIFRDGNPLTSVGAVTSYSDTSVTPGVTYAYTVKAKDAAGNPSDASNSSSAMVNPVDTQNPSAPQTLTATRNGASQVDLGWGASDDDFGVTGYDVYRNNSLIATVGATPTSYSDSPLAPGTYQYQVKARDAAGHVSDPSNTATVTVPDVTKPSPPGSLTATASSTTQIDLGWQAASDNVGVTGYRVFNGTTQVASLGSSARAYSDSGLAPNTSYSYTVIADDAAGNASDPSNTATTTTQAPPSVLTLTPEADARVQQSSPTTNYGTSTLAADFSTSTSNIESFLRFTVSGVPAGSVRSVKLRLRSTSDGTADGPAVYTTATNWSETTVNWNTRPAPTSAATDDKGAIPANTWVEYDVTPLVTGNGTYSFRLATSSTDGVFFSSRETAGFQPELVVTTGTPDTSKPTVPGNLTAVANGPNRIDLGWLSSQDNVGVTGYNVYRGGTLLAGIGATTSYADTSVAPNSTYDYQVRALDAASNLSDPSSTATASTPSAPSVLTISPEADTRVQQSSPTTNYATSTLGADFSTSTSNIESFLRFTVTGVPAGSVASAKLRLHSTSDGTADGPAVYTTATNWSETALNWNTRPAPTSAATDDKGAIASNSWVEYDVTPFVTGNGTYSFRLATSSSDGVVFSQREASTFRPELVVTLR